MHRLLVCLLLLTAIAPARAEALTPGAWRLVTRIVALDPDGGPDRVLTQSRTTNCMSPEFVASNPYQDAEKDNRDIGGHACQTRNYSRSGDTATWEMSCTTAGIGRSEGWVSATVTAHDLETEMRLTAYLNDGRVQILRYKTDGQYVGVCTSGMEPP